eukprot:6479758-Amphidinium_carterae.1
MKPSEPEVIAYKKKWLQEMSESSRTTYKRTRIEEEKETVKNKQQWKTESQLVLWYNNEKSAQAHISTCRA